MPYHFEWTTPGRVFLSRIEGNIQPEQINDITLQSRDMLLEGQAPVHLIIDTTGLSNIPFTLSNLSLWTANIPKGRMGWMIVVKPSKMASFALSIVSKTLNVKVKTAESVNEAINILHKVDQTLPAQLHQIA